MGFLDKLFGSPQANYTLEEAMEIIVKDLQKLEQKDKEEHYQSALKIHWELQQLSSLISDFGKKEIPESARSSAHVKSRFCSLAGSQLSSLEKPEKKNASGYINSAKLLLDNLGGLTHRQMMHINFFFREDFKPVAKKIGEINALIPTAASSEQSKAAELYGRLKQLEEQRKSLHDSTLVHEERLNSLKTRQLPSLANEPVLDNNAGDRLRNLKQEIDSFLAVQKLLKKYSYIQKIEDELLETYIESPSTALISDSSLKIISFVTEAADLVKEGKLPAEVPGRKIDSILNGPDYLAKKRAELLEAAALVKGEQELYSMEKERFEASLHARTNALAESESSVKQISRLIESAKKEQAEISSEISRLRVELCMLASKILHANVS